MVQLVKDFVSGAYNLMLGMFTTGKHIGRKEVTIQYPKERWEVPERSRGMVVLLTDQETGQLNCTACMLCMRACPTAAIQIEVEKDEKGKRHLKEFDLNYHICCFCGLCEEACNFAAIKLATKYEFPEFDSKKLQWTKKELAEWGRDVPYEKPVKKKPVAKKPVVKKPEDKPAEEKTTDKSAKAAADAAEQKPADKPDGEEKKAEEASSEKTPGVDAKTDDNRAATASSDTPAEKSDDDEDKGKSQ